MAYCNLKINNDTLIIKFWQFFYNIIWYFLNSFKILKIKNYLNDIT